LGAATTSTTRAERRAGITQEKFIERFGKPLTATAIAITGNSGLEAMG